MTCFLFDNGSLRPESFKQLRCIASQLEKSIGQPIRPVSLLHSSAIDPALLDDRPALLLEPALRERLAAGERHFLLLPLFFGPSRALTDYLPKRLAALRKNYPDMQACIAPCLVSSEIKEQAPMVDLLYEQVQTVIQQQGLKKPAVVLVDHGTPEPAVNAVRNDLAAQLATRLAEQVRQLEPASMERREGAAYAFNEPLLENILNTPDYNQGAVIILLLFLLPGRHAGPGGDIATICAAAEKRNPKLKTYCTALLGKHPGLISILKQRFTTLFQVYQHSKG